MNDRQNLVDLSLSTWVHPTWLLDKVSERLAFQRRGVQLYNELLRKLDTVGSFKGGPNSSELHDILSDENRHLLMLTDTLNELRGTSAVSPNTADMGTSLSDSVLTMVTDPGTSFLQSLEAIVVTELADGEAWPLLADLARAAGEDIFAHQCDRARLNKERHLRKIRRWIRAGEGLSDKNDSTLTWQPPYRVVETRNPSNAKAVEGPHLQTHVGVRHVDNLPPAAVIPSSFGVQSEMEAQVDVTPPMEDV